MRVEDVGAEALVAASEALLPRLGWHPPELAAPAVGPAEARYLAALRHGSLPAGSARLVARGGGRVRGVVAVSPSPFDEAALGVPTCRLHGLESDGPAEAEALARAALRAAADLGARLVLARLAPASACLAPLMELGLRVYGATVLLAGRPEQAGAPAAEPATTPDEIATAASIAGMAFRETHLSRDPRIGPERAAAVYERWVVAEAGRGAAVLLVRDGGGRPVATAVCRESALAPTALGRSHHHLHLLATHPAARGAGHGRAAALAASALAARAGASLLQTGVDLAATAAQRLYARMGLEPRSAGLILHGWLDSTRKEPR